MLSLMCIFKKNVFSVSKVLIDLIILAEEPL
jgi:hypothetical protein